MHEVGAFCCATRRLAAETRPTHEVGNPGPLHAQRKTCAAGEGIGDANVTGPGAGSSCGNAPMVANGCGCPGAAGRETEGTAAGAIAV